MDSATFQIHFIIALDGANIVVEKHALSFRSVFLNFGMRFLTYVVYIDCKGFREKYFQGKKL